MNLDEFRSQLDTDAQKRCREQEKTIHDLIAENKDLHGNITALQNRCFAFTRGELCLMCSMRRTCQRTVGKKEATP